MTDGDTPKKDGERDIDTHSWDSPSPKNNKGSWNGGPNGSTSASSSDRIGTVDPDNDYSPGDIKIILLGDSAVGKSKLVERYLLNAYTKHTASTYALNIFTYKYTDPKTKKQYVIDFWDTAGQEQFNRLHPSYYYEANACILAFDVTRKVTYKNMETWYQECRESCEQEIPVICIANKIDFDPDATQKKFAFASRHNLPFFYVSWADGTNVVRIFEEAIQLAIKNKENPPDEVLEEIYWLIRDDDNQ